eukprot:6345817-Prymnesium_polylepis.1
MALMAAMAARQVMVRSERTVACRIWSLMQIRQKRVGGAVCCVAATVKEEELASGVMRARA